jgi:hypothetical protein
MEFKTNTSTITIEENDVVFFIEEAGSNRVLLITDNPEIAMKAVKASGFEKFGNAARYVKGNFFMLRENFDFATRNGLNICISNQMWHIENHVFTHNKPLCEVRINE